MGQTHLHLMVIVCVSSVVEMIEELIHYSLQNLLQPKNNEYCDYPEAVTFYFLRNIECAFEYASAPL